MFLTNQVIWKLLKNYFNFKQKTCDQPKNLIQALIGTSIIYSNLNVKELLKTSETNAPLYVSVLYC